MYDAKRNTVIPLEEVFSNDDVKIFNVSPEMGYQFTHPAGFMDEPGDLKMIGIRRCKLMPSNNYIKTSIVIRGYIGTAPDEFTIPIALDINSEDSMSVILSKIKDAVVNSGKLDEGLTLVTNYEPKIGKLSMSVNGEETEYTRCTIQFTFAEDEAIMEFIRVFNQDATSDNNNYLQSEQEVLTFKNEVWDRINCRFHATFTGTNKMIGFNNDFYQNVSKLYSFRSQPSAFSIRFSTDGKHFFLPRHCDWVLELVYLCNYKIAYIP